MAITFEAGQSIEKDFSLSPQCAGTTWHLHGLDEIPDRYNICSYPSTAQLVKLTDVEYSMPEGLLIYHETNGEWTYYKKGWTTNTLEYLTPGETYYVAVPTASVWVIPQQELPIKYDLAVYYVYTPEDGYPDDWESLVLYYVQYEAEQIAEYVRAHGINGDMPIVSVEKLELGPDFFYDDGSLNNAFLMQQLKLLFPSYENSDLRAVIGSWNSGTNAEAFGPDNTVFMYLATIMADVKAMEGTPGYENRVYSELAHEFGHIFGCDHCINKPCPMAQQYITYNEWLNMNRQLWFCDRHKETLLNNWQIGNI